MHFRIKMRLKKIVFFLFIIGVRWFITTAPDAAPLVLNKEIVIQKVPVRKFEDPHPSGKVLQYWKLTDDPGFRDHANYHNTNCWSPDGRYICYTHHGMQPSIHIIDLNKMVDMEIDIGKTPRWGKVHNWLFYSRRNPQGGNRWEKGTEVVRFNLDTNNFDVITWGLEKLGSTDFNDRWIYGAQKLRYLNNDGIWANLKWHIARAPIFTGSTLEKIYEKNLKANHPLCNPMHELISLKAEQPDDMFGPSRIWLDLDGKNERIGVAMLERRGGHMAWSGDGQYLLAGNYQARGRRWDAPYPSPMHLLANIHVSDISQCGKSGRWICSDYSVIDLRSGHGTYLPRPPSRLCYPIEINDMSHLYDADPKGSPDGTKIIFVSNFSFETDPFTQLTQTVKNKITYLPVESTIGFPASGDIEVGGEVMSYSSKTPSEFRGLIRHKYDTGRYSFLKKDWYVTIFKDRLLEDDQKRNTRKPGKWLLEAAKDTSSPLLYQKQTDLYISVVRLPDRPFLRVNNNIIELIPGENHFETIGYIIMRSDKELNNEPLPPGSRILLPSPGKYFAVAVEQSGLKSLKSQPIEIEQPLPLKILANSPGKFSWTSTVWKTGREIVSKETAMSAASAVCETHHIYDGMIKKEYFNYGDRIRAEDLNQDKKVTRKLEFIHGYMKSREYFSTSGERVSLELFNSQGQKEEEVRWDLNTQKRQGRYPELHHWYFKNNIPQNYSQRGGKNVYKNENGKWLKIR